MESKKDIDVVKLLDKVDFNPDDVVTAAATNSTLFVEAIQYRLACMERKASTKIASDRTRAEVELATRKKYRDANEKVTEGNIDALVELDIRVKKSTDALAQAESYDEYSKLICEVFRMRRDCLKIVDDMTRDEMRQQSALEAGRESLRGQREELRKRFPGGN